MPPSPNESELVDELRALTRRFCEEKMRPFTEEDEEQERFRPEWIKGLGDLGLVGLPLREEYGGAGLGYREFTAVIEELGRVHAAYAVSVAVTSLTQMILQEYGSEEQKARLLPRLASGEAIGAFSLSEASSGSDAGSLRTTAKRVGEDTADDHYVVNGTKLWVTQGDVAQFTILMARTGGAGTKGVSAFILEKDSHGFKMGKREKKMGLSSSHTMEILLEDVKIPVANRIGNEGDGFKVAMAALDSGRINIAAAANGAASGALEVAISHAKLREQFGKPIAEFQGISFMLADMATGLAAAKLLVEKAASLKDAKLPCSKEASMAKLFSTDNAMKVTTDAVQILGGSGYTREFPVERYMREVKVMQIFEGTNQIQRFIIGRALTSATP